MSIEHEPVCESCQHHRATYRLDYSSNPRRSSFEAVPPFLVCWSCMVVARRGPRRPFVTIITAESAG